MEGRHGFNLDIAATPQVDSDDPGDHWFETLDWHGDNHLIRGLRQMKAVYESKCWFDEAVESDYLVCLGYSGVVLLEAIRHLQPPFECIFMWGFHDGDYWPLARNGPSGFAVLLPAVP